MMKKLFLIILTNLFCLHSYAQKEAQNWYFGEKAGLSFAKGYAEALTDGAMLAQEGSATMSDAETGELLFYTNGVQVWDRLHRVMPNGDGLLSDLSSTQSALIVPFPNQPHRYYLFTANSISHNVLNNPPGLVYSIINMELNNGLGDVEVATKNTRLLSLTTEQLTAVPHANQKDYWIITHGVGNSDFYVFHLTERGISEHKTTSIGMHRHEGDGGFDGGDVAGYLKASPDGKKLASVVWPEPTRILPIELFDFDPATGTISNALDLGVTGLPIHYGVSFSPDNTKLYVSGVAVYQFDLSLPTVQDIINSQLQLTPTPSHGSLGSTQSLQLGPDGRLYNNAGSDTFYIINYPNRAGLACQPERAVFDFKGGRASIGLPNFIQSYFNGLVPTEREQVDCDLVVQLYPNPTTGKVKFNPVGDCPGGGQFSLSIVNAIGQLVSTEQQHLHFRDEIDISGYAAGLYLFTLTFENNKRVLAKVIKVD